ncbi:hypothetical protein F5Y09DRAFT_330948 [Xylaria sp. FL1042]|nr:hypothetical protein F5Y09DRAFT_330948 [Xylaria sp. FL1042]
MHFKFCLARRATGPYQKAQKHAAVEHGNRRYPCPLAAEYDYESVFRSKVAARAHASSIHEQIRHPRPLADEEDCLITFSRQLDAWKHANTVHRLLRVPCPLADEYNCPKTFSALGDAKSHSLSHTGVKFACPVAEECGCDSVFAFQRSAQDHAKLHMLLSAHDVLQHAEDRDHRVIELFLCPIQTCRSATIGKQFTLDSVETHRKLHVSLGHIESGDFHESLDLAAVFPRNESLPGIRDTDSDSDVDEIDPEDISNASDGGGKVQDEFFSEEEKGDELESGILTMEHRLRILRRNTITWNVGGTGSAKHLKVRLGNLGLTCRGPTGGTRNMIFQRCPKAVTIDLDTARLLLRGTKLILDGRCVACHVHYGLRCFLKDHGIEPLQEPKTQTSVCTTPGCKRLSFQGYSNCAEHLSYMALDNHNGKPNFRTELFREMFKTATRREWTFQPQYNVRVSGKILVNTTIDHQGAILHNTPTEFLPLWSHISKSKAKHVYSSTRNSDRISHMNVHEVASKIQQVGITRDTIILVYHVSTFDLRLLRRFLESAGYIGLLPPDENCIPMVNILRRHMSDRLPGGRLFPLGLEMLFPLMYPRHTLVGLNHQSLVDCQQTRLVCMAYEQLCRPIAERGQEWQPDLVARSTQTSIFDWLTSEDGAGGQETLR